MRLSRIWLAAAVLTLGAAARGGESAPGPVAGTIRIDPAPAASPCSGGAACGSACGAKSCGPTLCDAAGCGRSACLGRIKEWLTYRREPGPGPCGCLPKPSCCPPSPYAFFLDRCQPRAGDCPVITPACDGCERGPRPVRDWMRSHLPIRETCGGGTCLDLGLKPLGELFRRSPSDGCPPAECPDGGCDGRVRFGWLRSHLGW